MSVYSVKGKGWRFDFTQNGIRYTEAWFTTKRQAKEAEARKREDLKNQPAVSVAEEAMPTDITFLDLVNLRLDYVKAYKSEKYYQDHIYTAKKLVASWGNLSCETITPSMVQKYLIRRSKNGIVAANKELRYLRAMFNYGIKQGLFNCNPTKVLIHARGEEAEIYSSSKDVAKVLLVANPETGEYLIAIIDTMARVGEINRLTWNDVDFERKNVVLSARKKKGGHLTPRKIPMTDRLYNMLLKRFNNRDKTKPWVFWQRYWSQKEGKFLEGPYQDRKLIMKSLCRKAGVKYFRFHALRHFGASVLETANVPIGSIQRILGHEHRTTTEIYLHSIGESEREAMAVFEEASQISLPAKSLTQTLTH